MSTAIKVENLSKAYQLGTIGTGTLSRDLERWVARLRGKEDPFLTIGEANDRSVKGSSDVVLSLNNLSFDIEQGDAVGIIGRNGAGKSTLLKLLSRVTSPTTGSIKVKGRIASLLEVGTGFHPELTGRENIFLNGAILGMRKREIARKFDQIVDFAGVERYIDTPVKRYSSGMYVRLAFAVAAHLESEILIVDEVLAVGDAEFQKKCLGKMGDVSKGEGRTVLFVSHNMAAVKTLCEKGILLRNGGLYFAGNVEDTLEKYNSLQEKIYTRNLEERSDRKGSGLIRFGEIKFFDKDHNEIPSLISGSETIIECYFKNNLPLNTKKSVRLDLAVLDVNEILITQFSTFYQNNDYTIDHHSNKVVIKIPRLNLLEGKYYFSIYSLVDNVESDYILNAGAFFVESGDYFHNGKVMNAGIGTIASDHKIEVI